MYTYQILENPPTAKVFYNENVIDIVGPWDSVNSAQNWVESYVNRLNLGISQD